MYRRPAEHPPIPKRRYQFTLRNSNHAVELLGNGQQYLVEGRHPKGGEYEWRTDIGPPVR
jgi:hypothetical protein